MTTGIHIAITDTPQASLRLLFWLIVGLAVAAALLRPFLPPRAHTDTSHEAQ